MNSACLPAMNKPFVAASCQRSLSRWSTVDRVVIRRIKRELLCHEHAGVVDQRIDATKLIERCFEHSLGGKSHLPPSTAYPWISILASGTASAVMVIRALPGKLSPNTS